MASDTAHAPAAPAVSAKRAAELPPPQRSIIWLASYPKSGNTWTRAFLANYQSDSDEPVDINNLGGGWRASVRNAFDEVIGIPSADMTADEIDDHRPEFVRRMSAEMPPPAFVKAHDAYTYNRAGDPIFPADACLGVIYLVRNPLDVAPSYANHSAAEIERMVKGMCSDAHMLAASKKALAAQLPQRALTWSGHVSSWWDQTEIPVCLVRYEDMLADPRAAFLRMIRFAGLDHDEAKFEKALEYSSFDQLKAQEDEHGFGEKMPRAKIFFRQGRTGGWREELTRGQVEMLVESHREMMDRLGYLEEALAYLEETPPES